MFVHFLKFINISTCIWWFCLANTAFVTAQVFPQGEIIDTVFCKHDSSQSYALYLPHNYDNKRKWPVVFIFDPAARGRLPVSIFQPGAEELGYILVGSNNSKNGSWEIAFDAADAMFVDVLSRFSVDSARIYTSGFSGGSRIATAVAVITGKIAGVIACGAGYPNVLEYQPQPSLSGKFIYSALVGDQDMNYQEHRMVEKDLNAKRINNNLIIFPAGHQWPPSDHIIETLYWLDLQAYKSGKAVSAAFTSSKAFKLIKNRADSIYNAQQLISAINVYESIIEDFDGLQDLGEINHMISEIKDSKEYKRQLRSDNKINDLEQKYRFEIGEAFTELSYTRLKVERESALKDMRWWQNEIDLFRNMSLRDNLHKNNMARRILNMIWARCAESSFGYADSGDYELAIILNKIWLYVEPESLWGHWSIAKLYAATGESDQALVHLTKVAENRPELLKNAVKNEPAFKEIANNPAFIALMKKTQ